MSASYTFRLENKTVFVAGETGLVGKALCCVLDKQNIPRLSAPRCSLDLTNEQATRHWFDQHCPDIVFMAAGRVGGIGANAADPSGFFHDNWQIAQNVLHSAARSGVKKLVYFGSSCIYPKLSLQPISEESLLKGRLEKTNQGYALAKIKAIRLCQAYYKEGHDFISVMPTNLYGPGDRYDLQESHVIPALIQKIAVAKASGAAQVELWGTGEPMREFLYVDDLARASMHALRYYSTPKPLNIGSGQEISIRALAETIAKIIGYEGDVCFDITKPDGTPRKLLDSSGIRSLGWRPDIDLKEGLENIWWDYQQIA